MIIGKVSNGIAFSPFLETPSITTPRSAKSSVSPFPSHFTSSSSDLSGAQTNNQITESARLILDFFINKGYKNQNLDRKNTIQEVSNPKIIIRQIRNSSPKDFEILRKAFIDLLKTSSEKEKEHYISCFQGVVEKIEEKLNNKPNKMSKVDNSPLDISAIASEVFSSFSQRELSPAAKKSSAIQPRTSTGRRVINVNQSAELLLSLSLSGRSI
jgi:hypothetical protein